MNILIKLWFKFFAFRARFKRRLFDFKDYSYMRRR